MFDWPASIYSRTEKNPSDAWWYCAVNTTLQCRPTATLCVFRKPIDRINLHFYLQFSPDQKATATTEWEKKNVFSVQLANGTFDFYRKKSKVIINVYYHVRRCGSNEQPAFYWHSAKAKYRQLCSINTIHFLVSLLLRRYTFVVVKFWCEYIMGMWCILRVWVVVVVSGDLCKRVVCYSQTFFPCLRAQNNCHST